MPQDILALEIIKMKRKLISLVVLSLLAFATLSVIPAAAADKPVVVVHLKGALEADYQLRALMNTSWIEWKIVYEDLSSSDLSGATMLFSVLGDSSLEYESSELSAIDSWFSGGGKTIYVSSDSDYGTDHLRQAQGNAILEQIGSKLRFEDCSVEDATSNGGAPYRVLAISDNIPAKFDYLVEGIDRGLFHGPGIVIGYDGSNYIDLSTDSLEDVYVIMTTSEDGVVVDNSEPTPYVMEAGTEGEFPVMVFEIDEAKDNTIIATGDAPFGQYMGLYGPEMLRADRYGADANPQEGKHLVENILRYATSIGDTIKGQQTTIAGLESARTTMQYAAVAALVIGVVIGFFVGPMIKKD